MNTDEMKAEAKRLRDACDAVLRSLSHADFPETCVNWGDLHCAIARIGIDSDGDVFREVTIEEASPEGNIDIELAITQALFAKFGHVEVRCEW